MRVFLNGGDGCKCLMDVSVGQDWLVENGRVAVMINAELMRKCFYGGERFYGSLLRIRKDLRMVPGSVGNRAEVFFVCSYVKI